MGKAKESSAVEGVNFKKSALATAVFAVGASLASQQATAGVLSPEEPCTTPDPTSDITNVTSATDQVYDCDGAISLREAVRNVNAGYGGGQVTFDSNLYGQSITLGSALSVTASSFEAYGLVDAYGQQTITINAPEDIFDLQQSNSTAHIQDFDLNPAQDGYGSAVMMRGLSDVTLYNSDVSGANATVVTANYSLDNPSPAPYGEISITLDEVAATNVYGVVNSEVNDTYNHQYGTATQSISLDVDLDDVDVQNVYGTAIQTSGHHDVNIDGDTVVADNVTNEDFIHVEAYGSGVVTLSASEISDVYGTAVDVEVSPSRYYGLGYGNVSLSGTSIEDAVHGGIDLEVINEFYGAGGYGGEGRGSYGNFGAEVELSFSSITSYGSTTEEPLIKARYISNTETGSLNIDLIDGSVFGGAEEGAVNVSARGPVSIYGDGASFRDNDSGTENAMIYANSDFDAVDLTLIDSDVYGGTSYESVISVSARKDANITLLEGSTISNAMANGSNYSSVVKISSGTETAQLSVYGASEITDNVAYGDLIRASSAASQYNYNAYGAYIEIAEESKVSGNLADKSLLLATTEYAYGSVDVSGQSEISGNQTLNGGLLQVMGGRSAAVSLRGASLLDNIVNVYGSTSQSGAYGLMFTETSVNYAINSIEISQYEGYGSLISENTVNGSIVSAQGVYGGETGMGYGTVTLDLTDSHITNNEVNAGIKINSSEGFMGDSSQNEFINVSILNSNISNNKNLDNFSSSEGNVPSAIEITGYGQVDIEDSSINENEFTGITINSSGSGYNPYNPYGGGYAVEISRTTIANNTEGLGGVTFKSNGSSEQMMMGPYGDLLIENSTISGNVVDSNFNSLYSAAAAVVNVAGDIEIRNSTVVNNVSFGYGVANFYDSSTVIRDSILSNAYGESEYKNYGSPMAEGGGFTVMNSVLAYAGAPSYEDGYDNQYTSDLGLGPLADNGGPTLTHALLPTSAAIGNGYGASEGLSLTDQRGTGFARLRTGEILDSGATQYLIGPNAVSDEITVFSNTATILDVVENDVRGASDAAFDLGTLAIVSSPSNGAAIVANGVIIYSPSTNFIGADTITYTITDVGGLTTDETTISLDVVNEANNAPTVVANPPSISAALGQVVTINLNDYFEDADNDTLSFDVTLNGDSLNASVAPNGTFTFDTALLPETGVTVLRVKATDGQIEEGTEPYYDLSVDLAGELAVAVTTNDGTTIGSMGVWFMSLFSVFGFARKRQTKK